jgi:hypothetical protein
VKFQSIQAKQKQKNLFQNLIKTWDATLATFDFDLTFCVILFAVSLANALAHVISLESKLKTTSKALKEADENRAKEVSAVKVSADKAVKEVEPRAIKA